MPNTEILKQLVKGQVFIINSIELLKFKIANAKQTACQNHLANAAYKPEYCEIELNQELNELLKEYNTFLKPK
jgi:hypothetical protein